MTRRLLFPVVSVLSVVATVLITSASGTETGAASYPVRARVAAVAGGEGALATAQGQFTTSARVVADGPRFLIVISVTSRMAVQAVVDVEVIAPNGRRLDQQYNDATSIPAGGTVELSFHWAPDGATRGEHRINVGLFAPGPYWRGLFHWHDAAARFFVP